MFRLDIKKRKYILIVGIILLCTAAIYRLYPSFQDLLSPSSEIELKERRVIKYQKRLMADRGLETKLNDLKRLLKNAEAGLLTGKTPSLAAVQIQDILQKITKESGVVIQRLRVLTPEKLEKKGYLSIPVEFYMDATISQLKEVLYRIGVFDKYLTIKNLRISYTRNKLAGNIRCQITLAGYMKERKA
jgi:hypothetical protein